MGSLLAIQDDLLFHPLHQYSLLTFPMSQLDRLLCGSWSMPGGFFFCLCPLLILPRSNAISSEVFFGHSLVPLDGFCYIPIRTQNYFSYLQNPSL